MNQEEIVREVLRLILGSIIANDDDLPMKAEQYLLTAIYLIRKAYPDMVDDFDNPSNNNLTEIFELVDSISWALNWQKYYERRGLI